MFRPNEYEMSEMAREWTLRRLQDAERERQLRAIRGGKPSQPRKIQAFLSELGGSMIEVRSHLLRLGAGRAEPGVS